MWEKALLSRRGPAASRGPTCCCAALRLRQRDGLLLPLWLSGDAGSRRAIEEGSCDAGRERKVCWTPSALARGRKEGSVVLLCCCCWWMCLILFSMRGREERDERTCRTLGLDPCVSLAVSRCSRAGALSWAWLPRRCEGRVRQMTQGRTEEQRRPSCGALFELGGRRLCEIAGPKEKERRGEESQRSLLYLRCTVIFMPVCDRSTTRGSGATDEKPVNLFDL